MRAFLALTAVGLMGLGAVSVHAQDMDALAKSLAEPKAEAPDCANPLPDGSCKTRQMRLPGSAAASSAAAGSAMASAASSVGRAVRADISMTFVKGSAELTAAAKTALDRLARSLVAVGSYRPFMVEGHTDVSGPRDVNMALSQARAQSVVSYLTKNGVDKARITAKGFGPDRPLKGRAADDAANRRVEVSAS